MCVRAQSCPTLCDPWTVACQAPMSMRFSRQENWSGLLFPSSGDLLDPGIKPRSIVSLALAGRLFTVVPLMRQHFIYSSVYMLISES